MISRIKGTQDHLDLRLYNFLQELISKHLKKYYFSQIETPILEPLELFKRTLGTQTDVVSKEMYLATTEHDHEENICLRPEATAPTVRAYFNAAIEARPWKVFQTGPMFRHERPQKGRYRQFTQTTIEILDAAHISHDVEFIMMLDRFFAHELGLTDYALKLNYLGCAQDRMHFKEKLHEFLNVHKAEICELCTLRKEKNILRVFDCKNKSCQELYKSAPELLSFLCAVCKQEWEQLTSLLSQLSVNYVYDARLVRGLDYYNKTVFEFIGMSLGAQNAFCGGGRYDPLATMLGATQELPAIGAAIGIERLLSLLTPIKDSLKIPHEPPLYILMPMSIEQHALALLLADELRAVGIIVETLLDGDSLKSMMRKANKLGATAALIIGSQEQETRTVSVKFLTTGIEEKISQVELVKRLKG